MNVKNTLKAGMLIFATLILITGCGQSSLQPVTPSVMPSATKSVTPSAIPSATPTSEEEWDLVYISDNSGSCVPNYLPQYIENDTGKMVNLHNYVIEELSAQVVLEALRGGTTNAQFSERLKGLKEAVADADEIIFFTGNYFDIEGMNGVTGDLFACFMYFAGEPPDHCTLEIYQPYTEVLSEIFEEMLALRDGKPTTIRALDLYNPYLDGQRLQGTEMENQCIQCWTTFNAAIRIAAEANSIPLVSVYDLFNGVNHNEDPNEKGYLGNSGFFPSPEGCQAIANRIVEEGHEPVSP